MKLRVIADSVSYLMCSKGKETLPDDKKVTLVQMDLSYKYAKKE